MNPSQEELKEWKMKQALKDRLKHLGIELDNEAELDASIDNWGEAFAEVKVKEAFDEHDCLDHVEITKID